jgi:dipeptidyl aminopeptidase/acylaminoacyl peptidase
MSQRKDDGRPGRAPRALLLLATGVLLSWLAVATAGAEKRSPYQAHAGLDLASAAARVWSADAELVYVENDETLADDGSAPRWGYLFYSSVLKKCRAYSIRGGAILVAEDLDMKFEAPSVNAGWIDSGAALAAADQAGGRSFRESGHASVSTMLLSRGAVSADDPDETTWTVIYSSPNAPSLFVLIDAAGGKVRRTWRG